MNWFLDERLAIGNAIEARDLELVHSLGIEAIVDLAINEPPAAPPREVFYLRLPLYDGEGNSGKDIRFAVESIVNLVQSSKRTLVCCSAGLSRSPTIAAAAISMINGIALEDALILIQDSRQTDVSKKFYDSVCNAIYDIT